MKKIFFVMVILAGAFGSLFAVENVSDILVERVSKEEYKVHILDKDGKASFGHFHVTLQMFGMGMHLNPMAYEVVDKTKGAVQGLVETTNIQDLVAAYAQRRAQRIMAGAYVGVGFVFWWFWVAAIVVGAMAAKANKGFQRSKANILKKLNKGLKQNEEDEFDATASAMPTSEELLFALSFNS